MSFRPEPPVNHLSPLSYAKDSLCRLINQDASEWTMIEVAVDSGACDTVMPLSSCSSIPTVSSNQSKAGMSYEVADGNKNPNLGERKCLMLTPGCHFPKKIIFQVADVHKPLLSVTRAADAGFDCLLGKEGGCLIPQAGGERVPIRRKGNLYVMTCWVRAEPTGFSRHP